MVWPVGGNSNNKSREVQELQHHYNTMQLTKSTSYGREIVASRLNEKHKAANTKKHQLPQQLHHHHSNRSPQLSSSPANIKNEKRRWSWGGNKKTAKNQEQERRPPQTPNHKVSAGRAFADRMIRTVSPTKKRNLGGSPSHIFSMTTAALTTTKPMNRQQSSPGQNNSHYSSIDSSLQTQTGREYRDESDQENHGAVGNSMASSPIHELNDRIARIEQRLYQEQQREQAPPPAKSTLRRSQSPSKLWSHHKKNLQSKSSAADTNPRRSSLYTHHHPYTYQQHQHDPPSSTSTPTLFAHTKQKMTQDNSADSFASSFSEEGVEPMAMARQILEFQQMQIDDSKGEGEEKREKSNTSKTKQKVTSKTPAAKLQHAAVHPYGPQTDPVTTNDDSSAAPLPPTPKTSNGHGMTSSFSADSQEQQQPEETTKHDEPEPKEKAPVVEETVSAEEVLQRQLPGIKFSSLSCHPTSPVKKELIQPLSKTPVETKNIPSQLPVPNPQEAKESDETNSILASVNDASSQLMGTLQAAISDLSSSTASLNKASRAGTAASKVSKSTGGRGGGGQLTIKEKGASLAIPSMSCLVPGEMTNMRRLCADSKASGDNAEGSESGTTGVVMGEVVSLVPGIPVPGIPREIPLVPGALTPDVSLMDHPDHISIPDEPSPRQPAVTKSPSPLKITRMQLKQEEARELPPRPPQRQLHTQPASPQAAIPNVPSNDGNEEDHELAQQYFETMYVEAEQTQDVLEDLLQTPRNEDPPASVVEDLLTRSMSPPVQQEDTRNRSSFDATKPDFQEKRVLFASSVAEEIPTKNRKSSGKRLVPRRKPSEKGLVRRVVASPEGSSGKQEVIRSKPENRPSSRTKRSETLASRSNIREQYRVETKPAETTTRSTKINMSLQPAQKQRKIPPSALMRGGDHVDTLPTHDTTRHDALLRKRQELDDARMDILLFNQSSSLGNAKKYKLSPYHPKMDASGKRGWFGRRQSSKDGHAFSGSTKSSSKGSKNGRTLEANASSVASAITVDSTANDDPRPIRRDIVQVSNGSNGSYHSLEPSDASSGISGSSLSDPSLAMSDPSVENGHNETNDMQGTMLPRATTYDDIIQDLKKFEAQLPNAEFAVVEVGDEDDAVAAHTYLVNKTSVENELRSGHDGDGPMMVEMPFGLETITEHSLEESYSLGTEDEGRAFDDSSMDNVKLSVSFAEQLRQIQMIQNGERQGYDDSAAKYHI